MNFAELFSIAVALSMDVLAVSVVCGLSTPNIPLKNTLATALSFGTFQCLMPVIGWNLNKLAYGQIKPYDHWVAFFILAAVGAKMVYDSFCGHNGVGKCFVYPLNPKILFTLSIATSLDALAVGISFSCLRLPILFPSVVIGIIAFLFCLFGINFGEKIGKNANPKFVFAGGIILILIGIKALTEN